MGESVGGWVSQWVGGWVGGRVSESAAVSVGEEEPVWWGEGSEYIENETTQLTSEQSGPLAPVEIT